MNIPQNIDEYIKKFPENVQEMLVDLRFIIQKAAPEANEKISYAMPTFYFNGNLVHFAAYANHIGFYPGPSAIIAFETELSTYKFSKGAIQFPINQLLPNELITRIVKFRVNENLQKPNKTKK